MYVDPDKLPLIIVTNGSLNGIYATSGYNVGTGDMLLRLHVTDITDIYRRNTGRIIDCVGDGLCPL